LQLEGYFTIAKLAEMFGVDALVIIRDGDVRVH
jgi:hypothetical protein